MPLAPSTRRAPPAALLPLLLVQLAWAVLEVIGGVVTLLGRVLLAGVLFAAAAVAALVLFPPLFVAELVRRLTGGASCR